MVELPAAIVDEITTHAVDGYPYEACGLVAGVGQQVHHFYPCRNAAESARVYTLDALDHLRAERDAEGRGWEIVGVVHSHTHSPAAPSATDVAQAPDPAWHYLIISLQHDDAPTLRSFRIVGGDVTEEDVTIG